MSGCVRAKHAYFGFTRRGSVVRIHQRAPSKTNIINNLQRLVGERPGARSGAQGPLGVPPRGSTPHLHPVRPPKSRFACSAFHSTAICITGITGRYTLETMSSSQHARHTLLSVLFIHEHDAYTAVCLEHFFAAQGSTLALARRAFARAFVTQVALDIQAGRKPLAQHGPAPDKYWYAFQHASRLDVEREPVAPEDVSIPPAFLVQAITETVPAGA